MDIVIIDGLSFALPLFIMAIGGIYCEKSGVTMLAVEGLQGFGAFIGAFVAVAIAGNFSGDSPVPFYIAMIMAAVGGSIFALIHALLCLKFKANQVISGVVVNILAMALTAYLTKLLNRVVFGATSDKFVLTVSSRITIPGISKIPVLGAVFTNLYPFELVIVVVAFIAWFVMYKTRFGMHLRACGDSEGDYVGMGWLDRKDVLQWIDWVLAQDSEAEIVLHGVSMGAATTMMTAGEDTPEQVKVFVEDCGYTSVWDIFSSELKLRFGLPEFPILYTASATARAKAGYGFKEASALQQVQNCEKPMLFIHGTADDFIPYEMMGTLYNAKPGTNKAAEGAGHGEAMDVLGDTYWNTVFDFEGQYMAG